jgi:hypothetical protein
LTGGGLTTPVRAIPHNHGNNGVIDE